MNKLNLKELLNQSPFIANNYILENFNYEEDDIRLCGSNWGGILVEESLESLFSYSNIDLMDGNKDISILKQGNSFYRVRNLINDDGSDGNAQHLDFSGLMLIGEQPKRRVYIEILDDGVTYDCEPTVNDVVECIIEEYHRHSNEIRDILDSVAIHGLSITEVVQVYAIIYNRIEEDIVIRIAEGTDVIDLKL